MKSILSLCPPAAMIALSVWFLWFNPYRSMPPEPVTVLYVVLLLIMPAILIIIAYLRKIKMLKTIGIVLSLPLALYLGLAAMPSYWSLMLVALALYVPIDAGKAQRVR